MGEWQVKIDLTGQRFGRLVVICEDTAPSKSGRAKWICQCDCGNQVSCYGTNLRRGTTKSCGCLQRELLAERTRTHGGWANNEPLYHIWTGIKSRCYVPTDQHYPLYGARGIMMCDEWRNDYAAFREWAENAGYQKGLSIDRIDVNGNYEPDNCRWADNYTQQNNKRNNVNITYNGETHTLKEWSRIRGINYHTLHQRRRLNWDVARMLEYVT